MYRMCLVENGQVIDQATRQRVPARAAYPIALFDLMLQAAHYTCVGAKAAEARSSIRYGYYDDDPHGAAARELVAAIEEFEQLRGTVLDSVYASYVTIFPHWQCATETEFETLLWSFLQEVHDADVQSNSAWDATVSADTNDPYFGFSVGGRAYFIVGMNPVSSRWSRRFIFPVLVFNSHRQFAALRSGGLYNAIRDAARERDRELQGCANPMMGESKTISEARQYSGKITEDDWKCPFVLHSVPKED